MSRFAPRFARACAPMLAALALSTAMTPSVFAQERTELPSAHAFEPTLERIATALEGAGMTIFARIDHRAAAQKAGLDMQPATVLVYGNPKGGTPLMKAAPALALDLPLRVLVREDEKGQTLVSFHQATSLTRPVGLPDEKAAPLRRGESLIKEAIQP